MAEKATKTLAELSKVLKKNFFTAKDIEAYFKIEVSDQFQKDLKNVEKIYKTEKERREVYKSLLIYAKRYSDKEKGIITLLEKQLKTSDQLVKSGEGWKDSLRVVEGYFNRIISQNKEIFEISHQMQLESNVTWGEYRKLYNGAYEAARKMNNEFGQSVVNAKDLVEVQNKLLGTGWKDIKTSTLTNLSASVRLMQDTLGSFPEGISTALQFAYRQFGDETDKMATKLGNQLNAFSDSFGVSIGMLTGVVTDLAANNSFIARSNMQAQMMANESLIKAAALSGAVGLTSTSFISNLAGTAQFGTIEEMSSIYQGGAMLQGFDTSKFQQQMIGQDYEGATTQLFGSISETLNGIDDHYLRAEYMDRIGSSFGLSDSDLLQITTNGSNLASYTEDLQDKLKNLDNSMVDEVRDLKVTLVDRLENFFGSSPVAQGIGSILQETGLYGAGTELKSIRTLVAFIAAKQFGITGLGGKALSGLGSMLGFGTKAATASQPLGGNLVMGGMGTLGKTLGGLGIATAGNVIGRNVQMDTSRSNNEANLIGGVSNIGTGALGGFLAGGPIGAAVGAGIGLVNTIVSANDRKSAMEELADEKRRSENAESATFTGDPVVDAINSMNANITNVLKGEGAASRNMQFVLDMKKANSTNGGM